MDTSLRIRRAGRRPGSADTILDAMKTQATTPPEQIARCFFEFRAWWWISLVCWVMSLTAILAAPPAQLEAEVQIRYYPQRNLRVYEVDARHGLSSALLQNAAIIN